MATHHDQSRLSQNARCSPLDHRKVRVRSNRNYHRSAIDVFLEQCERIINSSRHRRNCFRPIATFFWQRWPRIETTEARIGARRYGDVTAAGETQRVTRVTSALPSMLGHSRDAAQVCVGPLENHRYCAEIIDVSTDVGVDVDVSQRSAMVEVSVSIAERCDSIQRNRRRNGASAGALPVSGCK
jgi:hypothetical protein